MSAVRFHPKPPRRRRKLRFEHFVQAQSASALRCASSSQKILLRNLFWEPCEGETVSVPEGHDLAGVAQLAEQLICNQQVAGSIPVTSSKQFHKNGKIPERPNGSDCKSDVNDFGGSNPPLPTTKKPLPCARAFSWWEEVAERNAAWFARASAGGEALPRGPLWGVGKIHLRLFRVPMKSRLSVPFRDGRGGRKKPDILRWFARGEGHDKHIISSKHSPLTKLPSAAKGIHLILLIARVLRVGRGGRIVCTASKIFVYCKRNAYFPFRHRLH